MGCSPSQPRTDKAPCTQRRNKMTVAVAEADLQASDMSAVCWGDPSLAALSGPFRVVKPFASCPPQHHASLTGATDHATLTCPRDSPACTRLLMLTSTPLLSLLKSVGAAHQQLQQLHVVCNDHNPVALARAALLLLLATELDPDVPADMSVLWDVLTNALWQPTTWPRVKPFVKQLVDGRVCWLKPARPEDQHVLNCIFQWWLLEAGSPQQTPSAVLQQRLAMLNRFPPVTLNSGNAGTGASTPQPPSELTIDMWVDFQSKQVLPLTEQTLLTPEQTAGCPAAQKGVNLQDRIRTGLEQWIKTGTLTADGGPVLGADAKHCINVTMLQPGNGRWLGEPTSHFVQCWGPFSSQELVAALHPGPGDGLLARAAIVKMTAILKAFQGRVSGASLTATTPCAAKATEPKLQLRVMLAGMHPLHLCLSAPNSALIVEATQQENAQPASFDIIDTGDLADELGLLPVLVAAGPRLAPALHARLHCCFGSWATTSDTMKDYLEKQALCMSIRHMPTMLGLRLLTDTDAGRPEPLDINLPLANSKDFRHLVWGHPESFLGSKAQARTVWPLLELPYRSAATEDSESANPTAFPLPSWGPPGTLSDVLKHIAQACCITDFSKAPHCKPYATTHMGTPQLLAWLLVSCVQRIDMWMMMTETPTLNWDRFKQQGFAWAERPTDPAQLQRVLTAIKARVTPLLPPAFRLTFRAALDLMRSSLCSYDHMHGIGSRFGVTRLQIAVKLPSGVDARGTAPCVRAIAFPAHLVKCDKPGSPEKPECAKTWARDVEGWAAKGVQPPAGVHIIDLCSMQAVNETTSRVSLWLPVAHGLDPKATLVAVCIISSIDTIFSDAHLLADLQQACHSPPCTTAKILLAPSQSGTRSPPDGSAAPEKHSPTAVAAPDDPTLKVVAVVEDAATFRLQLLLLPGKAKVGGSAVALTVSDVALILSDLSGRNLYRPASATKPPKATAMRESGGSAAATATTATQQQDQDAQVPAAPARNRGLSPAERTAAARAALTAKLAAKNSAKADAQATAGMLPIATAAVAGVLPAAPGTAGVVPYGEHRPGFRRSGHVVFVGIKRLRVAVEVVLPWPVMGPGMINPFHTTTQECRPTVSILSDNAFQLVLEKADISELWELDTLSHDSAGQPATGVDGRLVQVSATTLPPLAASYNLHQAVTLHAAAQFPYLEGRGCGRPGGASKPAALVHATSGQLEVRRLISNIMASVAKHPCNDLSSGPKALPSNDIVLLAVSAGPQLPTEVLILLRPMVLVTPSGRPVVQAVAIHDRHLQGLLSADATTSQGVTPLEKQWLDLYSKRIVCGAGATCARHVCTSEAFLPDIISYLVRNSRMWKPTPWQLEAMPCLMDATARVHAGYLHTFISPVYSEQMGLNRVKAQEMAITYYDAGSRRGLQASLCQPASVTSNTGLGGARGQPGAAPVQAPSAAGHSNQSATRDDQWQNTALAACLSNASLSWDTVLVELESLLPDLADAYTTRGHLAFDSMCLALVSGVSACSTAGQALGRHLRQAVYEMLCRQVRKLAVQAAARDATTIKVCSYLQAEMRRLEARKASDAQDELLTGGAPAKPVTPDFERLLRSIICTFLAMMMSVEASESSPQQPCPYAALSTELGEMMKLCEEALLSAENESEEMWEAKIRTITGMLGIAPPGVGANAQGPAAPRAQTTMSQTAGKTTNPAGNQARQKVGCTSQAGAGARVMNGALTVYAVAEQHIASPRTKVAAASKPERAQMEADRQAAQLAQERRAAQLAQERLAAELAALPGYCPALEEVGRLLITTYGDGAVAAIKAAALSLPYSSSTLAGHAPMRPSLPRTPELLGAEHAC